MASTHFELGAYAEVTTFNRTHSIDAGNFLVIAQTTSNARKATVEIYGNEVDAKVAQAGARGTAPAGSVKPTPLKRVTSLSKTQVSNILGSAQIEYVMKQGSSVYNGKEVKAVVLPVIINGIYQGVTTTDATVEHVGTTFAYIFKHGGHTVKVPTSEEDVKKNLGMAPVQSYPVVICEAITGKALLEALKTCPGSHSINDP